MSARRHALPFAALALAVLGVHQESQRHLEDLVHFRRIGHEREAFAQHADHRQDGKTRPRLVAVHETGNGDEIGGDAGFFMRLAQRRRGGGSIGVIHASARKTHLSRMTRQGRGALREQHRRHRLGVAVEPLQCGWRVLRSSAGDRGIVRAPPHRLWDVTTSGPDGQF